MALINNNFLKLPQNYLFSDIAKKVNAYKTVHPQAKIISLGIGDVTLPLPQESIKALHKACDEMSDRATFKGPGTRIPFFKRENHKTRIRVFGYTFRSGRGVY